jgi:hypothetical protein
VVRLREGAMLAAAAKAEEEAEDEAREAKERATGETGTKPNREEGDIDLVMCDVDGDGVPARYSATFGGAIVRDTAPDVY